MVDLVEMKEHNKSFTSLLSLYRIISQNANHLLTKTIDNITTLEQHYVEIGILCNSVPPTIYILTYMTDGHVQYAIKICQKCFSDQKCIYKTGMKTHSGW